MSIIRWKANGGQQNRERERGWANGKCKEGQKKKKLRENLSFYFCVLVLFFPLSVCI